MKLCLQYGQGVLVLPERAFTDFLPPDASYLYVLLAVCRRPDVLADSDGMIASLAAVCRLPERIVKNAVAYWTDAGILTEAVAAAGGSDDTGNARTPISEHPSAETEPETPEKPPRAALPNYPPEELARIIDETDGLRAILDECARIAGKLFSEHECAQLTALYDTYGLDGAYLMTVFMYCKKQGKTSVSYVIKTALGLYDDGIRSAEALDIHIAERDRVHDMEYKIRKLFGFGERTLTKAEREYIETWTLVWNMPFDVITHAYEITIKNIEKPRLNYTNKILSAWYESGIRTLDAVNEAEAAYRESQAEKQDALTKAAKPSARTGGSKDTNANGTANASYDLDEFLDLAMKRSFEES